MKRGGQPTLPPSTATSRRPSPTTIILRLRPREPAPPLPLASSAASSGADPPLESAGGDVDAEGVLPPAPATTAGATEYALLPAAIGDGVVERLPSTRASPVSHDSPIAQEDGLLRSTTVMPLPDVEEPVPSSTASPVSHASPIAQEDGLLPSTTVMPLHDLDELLPSTTENSIADALIASTTGLELPDLWGDLFLPDLLRQVASLLRLSRKDVERMRAVCSAWREAIPSTIDPFLVLSKKMPEVDSEVVVMQIERSNLPEYAQFKMKLPFSPPPSGVSCWGSAQGLMALQCHNPDTREILVYCIQCGQSKKLLPLPMGLVPKGIFLEPLTPQRFVLMAQEHNADANLYVDSDGFPWPVEGGGMVAAGPRFRQLPSKEYGFVAGYSSCWGKQRFYHHH